MRTTFVVALLLTSALLFLPNELATAQNDATVEAKGIVCGAGAGDRCHPGIPGAALVFTEKPAISLPTDDNARYETRTDREGAFVITAPEGDYKVNVTRAGFEPLEQDIKIQAGGLGELFIEPLTIEAQGSVISSSGSPTTGTVLFGGATGEWEATIDNGAFSVAIPAGWYHIDVRADDHAARSDWRFVDGENTLRWSVKADPQRDVTLTGLVTDQHGEPVAAARVSVWQDGCYDCYYLADDEAPKPASGDTMEEDYAVSIARPEPYPGGHSETRTDANGRYTLKVFSGHANFNIWKDGYASHYEGLQLTAGTTTEHDVVLKKFPDKTAHVIGRVVDAQTGSAITSVGLNFRQPEFGIWECSAPESERNEHCAIVVRKDGTFEGRVTPGYTIVSAHHEHWRTCSESRDSDGSLRRECGQQYLAFTQTLTLAANGTTELTIRLQPRPAPDATVSGYIIDDSADTAISGARIEFSNQLTYGHAWATTDGDGSYKVRLRSGYHHVTVWAEGYLPWQGTLSLKAGETPFDVRLTPGKSADGGCCFYGYGGHPEIAYATDVEMARDDAADGTSSSGSPRPPTATAGGTAAAGEDVSMAGGDGSSDFEDLGGGLGPYDPAARAKATEPDDGIPAPGVALTLAALAAAAVAIGLRSGVNGRRR